MFIHTELNIPCESNIVRNIQMGKCYANKILTAYNVWFSADLSYSMPYATDFEWCDTSSRLVMNEKKKTIRIDILF